VILGNGGRQTDGLSESRLGLIEQPLAFDLAGEFLLRSPSE